jgi:hypothetical protein
VSENDLQETFMNVMPGLQGVHAVHVEAPDVELKNPAAQVVHTVFPCDEL